MSDSLLRWLAMLGHVPASPSKISARELHARLASEGYPVSRRSVERDLDTLSGEFPLQKDDGRPAGWSWARGKRVFLPGMDASTALAYELVSRYLEHVLPKAVRARLEPDFQEARRVLDRHETSPMGQWSRRIAVLQSGQPLLAPEVSSRVSDIVQAALLDRMRFEADYRAADAEVVKRHVFNPHGLVHRQGVQYLVATLHDFDNPLVFALHRMSNVKALDHPCRPIEGFDLRRYLAEDRGLDVPMGGSVRLELRISPWLARLLGESRLSTDQVIAPIRNSDRKRLSATVPETGQLEWWLRSFADEVEVLKPRSLRTRMAEGARRTAALYGKGRRRQHD